MSNTGVILPPHLSPYRGDSASYGNVLADLETCHQAMNRAVSIYSVAAEEIRWLRTERERLAGIIRLLRAEDAARSAIYDSWTSDLAFGFNGDEALRKRDAALAQFDQRTEMMINPHDFAEGKPR